MIPILKYLENLSKLKKEYKRNKEHILFDSL